MKIAVAGCMGRMGRTLMEHLSLSEHLLIGGTVRPGQEEDAVRAFALLGVQEALVTAHPMELLQEAGAIIDFTRPEHTLAIAEAAAQYEKIHICGTTGLTPEQQRIFAHHGHKARIVHAPNMSIGVNLLMRLVEQVASVLDEEYDIELYEMHHKHKADAPSGTALGLGRAAAKGRGATLEDVADYGRHGLTGERMPGRIGFSVARGGDVVGDHTITFAGHGERLELSHKASSRVIYARGALHAAVWAATQPPGYYTMQDVLGV